MASVLPAEQSGHMKSITWPLFSKAKQDKIHCTVKKIIGDNWTAITNISIPPVKHLWGWLVATSAFFGNHVDHPDIVFFVASAS